MTEPKKPTLHTIDELRMLAADPGHLDVVAHGLAEHAAARAAELVDRANDLMALAEQFAVVATDLRAGTRDGVTRAAVMLAAARRVVEEARDELAEVDGELKAMFDAAYCTLAIAEIAGDVERAVIERAAPAPRAVAGAVPEVALGRRLVPGVR